MGSGKQVFCILSGPVELHCREGVRDFSFLLNFRCFRVDSAALTVLLTVLLSKSTAERALETHKQLAQKSRRTREKNGLETPKCGATVKERENATE